MKYTAEEVRDYADACRLAHKGPVIADMLTELAARIKVDESAAPVGFVMEATATRHKFGLLTQDLPPGAELFAHPPAQAGEAKALGACPKHGVEYVGECSGCAMTLPEKDFTHPPAQAAQGEVVYCPECGSRCTYRAISMSDDVIYEYTPAQPAQSVDVAKVREVIAGLRDYDDSAFNVWADKLTAALPESKP